MAPFVSPAFIAPPTRTAAPEPRVDLANPRQVPLQLPGTPSPVESPLGSGGETGFPLIPGELAGPLGRVDFDPLKALGNVWDWLNRRETDLPGDFDQYDITKPLTSPNSVQWVIFHKYKFVSSFGYCSGSGSLDSNEERDDYSVFQGTSVYFDKLDAFLTAGCPNSGGSGPVEGYLRAKVDGPGGLFTVGLKNGAVNAPAGYGGSGSWRASVTGVRRGGVDLSPERSPAERYPLERPFTNPSPATLAPQPLPLPQPGPSPRPAADPAEQPLPETAPQPPPVPVRPDGTPGTAPGVSPGTRPGVDPGRDPPPRSVPDPLRRLVPNPTPIGPDGRPIAQPVPAPIPTPKDQTSIGTTVIPGTGPAPRPDLQGIATEVGKIERKLELMMLKPAPASPENPPLDLGSITDLIQLLIDLLQQVYAAGSYQLAPVCEEGAPEVVSWSGGVGQFAQVNVKLDALADLLQAHKDMRQPICRQKASGEEVTVIFEEI